MSVVSPAIFGRAWRSDRTRCHPVTGRNVSLHGGRFDQEVALVGH